jgi:DNA polymerase III subunit epsilon
VSWWQFLTWRPSASKHPAILLNEERCRTFDANRAIESYEFVAFDTELTGLHRRRDEIVSLAAVRIRHSRIALGDSFHSLMRTRKKFIGEGTFVHRITPEQIRDAPMPEQVLPEFFDFCQDSVIVGHLPELDFSFLNKVSRRVMGGVLRNPCLDSMELARTLWKLRENRQFETLPKIRSFNLTELSGACHLPMFASHDALCDALQTACLFLFLVDGLRKLGLTTFKDFYRVGGIR